MNNKLKHFRVKVSKIGGEGYGVFKMVITNLCFCVSAEEQNQFEFHTFTATNGHKSQYFSQSGRNFYVVAFSFFFRISSIWQVSQDSVYKRLKVQKSFFSIFYPLFCATINSTNKGSKFTSRQFLTTPPKAKPSLKIMMTNAIFWV